MDSALLGKLIVSQLVKEQSVSHKVQIFVTVSTTIRDRCLFRATFRICFVTILEYFGFTGGALVRRPDRLWGTFIILCNGYLSPFPWV
jgi:hypothetical protein